MRWSVRALALLLAVNVLPLACAADDGGTTAAASAPFVILSVDPQGDGPSGDCLYLKTDATASSDHVHPFSVRLTPCAGYGAGSQVGGAAPDAHQFASDLGWTASWQDVDNDGVYEQGEAVYADVGGGAGLGPTALRLTAAAGRGAGTYVALTDPDAGRGTIDLQASVAFVDRPCDASIPDDCAGQGDVSFGDRIYLLAGVGPGLAEGSPVPGLALRMSGQGSGTFGTQVPPSEPADEAPSDPPSDSAQQSQASEDAPPSQPASNSQSTSHSSTSSSSSSSSSSTSASPASAPPNDAPDADADAAVATASEDAGAAGAAQETANAEQAGGEGQDAAFSARGESARHAPSGMVQRLERAGVPLWSLGVIAAATALVIVAVTLVVRAPRRPAAAARTQGPERGRVGSAAVRPEGVARRAPQRPK